ncbi:hypothetical protein P261_01266 [Lachnospiraceae bacterium TWA4]|nr:hypothetical protein P261_01266 [Lachnospiraceae bacterium TWA4]
MRSSDVNDMKKEFYRKGHFQEEPRKRHTSQVKKKPSKQSRQKPSPRPYQKSKRKKKKKDIYFESLLF